MKVRDKNIQNKYKSYFPLYLSALRTSYYRIKLSPWRCDKSTRYSLVHKYVGYKQPIIVSVPESGSAHRNLMPSNRPE